MGKLKCKICRSKEDAGCMAMLLIIIYYLNLNESSLCAFLYESMVPMSMLVSQHKVQIRTIEDATGKGMNKSKKYELSIPIIRFPFRFRSKAKPKRRGADVGYGCGSSSTSM